MFNFIKKLFAKKDYSGCQIFHIGGGWGDNIGWLISDNRTRVVGWKKEKPKVGDLLYDRTKNGNPAVFQFTKIEYCHNPPDMFFGDVKHIGYSRQSAGN